ncbi:MAG: DNA repair ATPase [Polyangiaceae bacterium]|nr:DNA repair ATPase [Polyangiaceae bacterium]MCW5790333.1 DNA repair ATPase [Polyangiaceae bacterium]
MADTDNKPAGGAEVEGGSYEIIRARLLEQARRLGERAEQLNERRRETFGGQELTLLGNERVRTANNCVPRDIVMVQGKLLFGYNVFIGLRTETQVSDVLSLHRFVKSDDGFDVGELPADAPARQFLEDARFQEHFVELYKYYKDARLIQLSRGDGKLLAVFQIGGGIDDIRVFRWTLDASGQASYVDNRGERDYTFPPAQDFEWTTTTRDQHVGGKHPHINILDEVFVECSDGDLTIKIEDNTETGKGIYAEPVDEPRQALDDGQFAYAKLGHLILLKVLPYNERIWRYLVYATRPRTVVRIDAIGTACVQLPEDHGVIFPGGYVLMDGQHKVFDGDFTGYVFKRLVRSPNGEDVLYVFYHRATGQYALFSYNLIRKEVQNPILCTGYTLFDDGRLVVFRQSSDEATRVHPMQFWQTPFVSQEYAAAQPAKGGALGKIGNAELVHGISDCLSIRRMIAETEPTRQIYEDLIGAVVRAQDDYFWLGQEEALDLLSVLTEIKSTAELIVDEFDKVTAIKQRAVTALSEAVAKQEALLTGIRPGSFTRVEQFMSALTELRNQRGHLIGLRELRYMDTERVVELEQRVVQEFDLVSRATADFLQGDAALAPLTQQLTELLEAIEQVTKTPELVPLAERVEATGEGLTVMSEVVGTLEVADPTARTEILERISEVFGGLNRVRATLHSRRRALQSAEGQAEFAAQFKLLGQNVQSSISLADTPVACEEQLARLMVQLEELEAKFSEFDDFVAELAGKRDEIYEAFNQKKQQLLDERARRAQNLVQAADRILSGVARRSLTFTDDQSLNAYFASDPMVLKVRDLAARLTELEEAPKADELESRLKQARQDALRGLRDRSELFEGSGGAELIRLGRHRFSVNSQTIELTLLPTSSESGQVEMMLSLTGTDFREPVDDPEFNRYRDYWEQQLVSETNEVYRGEYLAALILRQASRGEEGLSIQALHDAERTEGSLEELVRRIAAARYDEGYERGLHDADAAKILRGVLTLRESAGLLRFSPETRALATWYWASLARGGESERRAQGSWQRRAQSLGRLSERLGDRAGLTQLATELTPALRGFAEEVGLTELAERAAAAASYLVEELAAERVSFIVSEAAQELRSRLTMELDQSGALGAFKADLQQLEGEPGAQLQLVRAWLSAVAERSSTPSLQPGATGHAQPIATEAAVFMLSERLVDHTPSSGRTELEVTGLLGDHRRLANGSLALRIDEFEARLGHFLDVRVPGFRAFRAARQALLERERARLRLDEFKPKVLSSFVRNRLINEVYLPLIGDNFAKQLGAAGDAKRTDLMGMLLLISPPGYGKTTLMEYVASRLGLVFMKVNGPALGHAVHSLDPSEAPNATARQEVDKINLALEMGNNVMLYLDDIQHTHPELLQKFISLCDAQRRIEGVWRGKTRTYDLRGKRFCVVMAGNPYTESGDKFQIPDMLANRADTYNLGDVLDGRDEVFALSYIENAVTSNSVLAPLASRSQKDLYTFIRIAKGEEVPSSELTSDYSAVEVSEIRGVLERLFKVQEVLLKVNLAYIASASMDDKFRTEPPFKLQGSYRNMAKLAEKVVSAMNDAELVSLIDDHYAGESQTLTSGAEQNLLKLAELRGTLSPEQAARWAEIKQGFKRHLDLGGSDTDPVVRVTSQLTNLAEQLSSIRDTISGVAAKSPDQLSWVQAHVQALNESLARLTEPKVALTVKNEAPPHIDELLSMQIKVMEQTLVPFVRVATQRLDDSHLLRERLDEFIEQVKGIDLRLKGALGPGYGTDKP